MYLASQNARVKMTLSRNQFTKNVASKGGSLYCYHCEIVESKSNQFNNSYANLGGDIFLHNLKLLGTTPAKFSFHKHYNTIANTNGAGFYYLEESTSLVSRISLV
jgi:hypothetical protein